jgi:hypothetical protein
MVQKDLEHLSCLFDAKIDIFSRDHYVKAHFCMLKPAQTDIIAWSHRTYLVLVTHLVPHLLDSSVYSLVEVHTVIVRLNEYRDQIGSLHELVGALRPRMQTPL